MSLRVDPVQLSGEEKSILSTLKNRLDEIEYDPILRSLRGTQYFTYPWPDYHNIISLLSRLPPSLRDLYSLLLLGKVVESKSVEQCLEEDLVEGLIGMGILKNDNGELYMNGLSIVSYSGYYFIAEIPPVYPTHDRRNIRIYMGSDSYYLAQRMTIPKGANLLDLCSGTGIQAILASSRARKTVGVELDEKAVKIAEYNITLNKVDRKVEMRRGDLYEPVEAERFNFISSNPPYMPVPSSIKLEGFGFGGENGLQVIEQILRGLDDHLILGGRGVISGWGIGTEARPFIADKLGGLSEKEGFSIKLLLTTRKPLDYEAHRLALEVARLNQMNVRELIGEFKALFMSLGATSSNDFVVYIDKINRSRFKVIDISNTWKVKDKPRLTMRPNFVEKKQYQIPLKSGTSEESLLLGEQSVQLLKLCDGHSEIGKILENYFENVKVSSQFHVDWTLSHFLDLCNHLEIGGIVERDGLCLSPFEQKIEKSSLNRFKNFLFRR